MFKTTYLNRDFFFSKVISQHFKKKVFLKLENQNLTGSHKDRECRHLIDLAIKKKYKKIGCASTGNLAISLAFYSKLNNLKCFIWLNKKTYLIKLLEELGAKVTLKKVTLKDLYTRMEKNLRKI